MYMEHRAILKREALRFANKVRKQLGLPPVKRLYKGQRQQGESCPITMTVLDDDLRNEATYVSVSTNSRRTRVYRHDKPVVSVEMSPKVREFVSEFDRGDIPELVG